MLSEQQRQAIDDLSRAAIDMTFPACQIHVLAGGATVYSGAFGYLDPETRKSPTQPSTRFDLASLSMLFTAAAFMTFVDQGVVDLDQPVRDVLPEFSGIRTIAAHPFRDAPAEPVDLYPRGSRIDVRKVTFRHVLAHNSGLPAWLPLHVIHTEMRELKRSSAHIDYVLRDMVTGTMFAYPPSRRVVFSDVGFMVLGFVLERIGRKPLRQLIRERVVDRLGLLSVCYGELPCDDVAPTEKPSGADAHLCGKVHDQNAAAFDGVAGHSGLFAHAADIARLGETFRVSGGSLLSHDAVVEMTRLQAEEGSVRRGLAFALHSANELATSSPLSLSAYGHLGFTGASLWVDPERELVVACLTNHAYYGTKNDDSSMNAFRLSLNRLLADAIPVRR
jgi:CubicO group peptidase (beta-lactamase class C family)